MLRSAWIEILPLVPTGTIAKLAIVSFAIRLLTADVARRSDGVCPNGNDLQPARAIWFGNGEVDGDGLDGEWVDAGGGDDRGGEWVE